MNVDNIRRVADAIEAASRPEAVTKLGFNMNHWYYTYTKQPRRSRRDMTGHNCSTLACIAGWTVVVIDDDWKPSTSAINEIDKIATELLGLSIEQANELFYALVRPMTELSDITPALAVAVLRHLAETGEVDWFIEPC